mgnify:CR=1 FL=1
MSWQITGLRAWITQRLSAVVLLGLGLYLIAVWAWIHPETYAAWHAMVGAPVPGGAALLIFGALLLHCWVGVRDVILDYVRSKSLRLVLLAALALWLSGLGVWGGRVILGAML